MKFIIFLVLAIVNIPIYKYLKEMVFNSDEEFKEALGYWFTPDVISLFRGKYLKDRFAEFKLGILFFLCFIVVGIQFLVISGLLSVIFN